MNSDILIAHEAEKIKFLESNGLLNDKIHDPCTMIDSSMIIKMYNDLPHNRDLFVYRKYSELENDRGIFKMLSCKILDLFLISEMTHKKFNIFIARGHEVILSSVVSLLKNHHSYFKGTTLITMDHLKKYELGNLTIRFIRNDELISNSIRGYNNIILITPDTYDYKQFMMSFGLVYITYNDFINETLDLTKAYFWYKQPTLITTGIIP